MFYSWRDSLVGDDSAKIAILRFSANGSVSRLRARRNNFSIVGGTKSATVSATFAGDDLDASLIQLLELRFLSPEDPRFQGTLNAVEAGLRRGSHMLRYASEDDFGFGKLSRTISYAASPE